MKKILFAASEAIPFVKTGGLADVTGSLPKYFDRKRYDVRVILPKYICMEDSLKEKLQFVCRFYVNLSWRRQYVGIFQATYQGVIYYFVDNEFYFAGESPYNNMHEDIEKFAYFSKAVLAALPYLDFCPDVIHCHDWQTGLIPVFLHTMYGDQHYYDGIQTVFSIHNLKFQGRFRLPAVMDITGLPEQIFTSEKLESYGEANYLKGGVVYANAVTTVSPSYSCEIMTPEGGEGLDGLMRAKSDSLYGILNGIDYEVYNPARDGFLFENYGIGDVTEKKGINKTEFQKKLRLPVLQDVFLVGMVSRLTDQKGFDLIAYILDELLDKERIQLVFAGRGEERYEDMLRHFAHRYPDKVRVIIGYSEELAHRIYGSCDAFLMPSLFEPCGLSQMMSQRYGTVPIVRETGGLKDTVEPYNQYEHTGTGFSFANYNAHELLHAIKGAMQLYYRDKKEWNGLVKRGMRKDFSWENSAAEYAGLYNRLTDY